MATEKVNKQLYCSDDMYVDSEVDQNSRRTGSGCFFSQNMLNQHRCFRGAVDACSPINDALTSSNLTFATLKKINTYSFNHHPPFIHPFTF